jgi:hypothetical protein
MNPNDFTARLIHTARAHDLQRDAIQQRMQRAGGNAPATTIGLSQLLARVSARFAPINSRRAINATA